MNNWYKKSFWRNLVDMHIPDWNPEFLSQFDPEHYADMMEKANVDTAIIYAGSCLGICYWPTKVGHMHNGIKGRDIFGETVKYCREKGINVIGYFNMWSRWAFENYPEWRMLNVEGYCAVWNYNRESPGRYRVCCLNSQGYRDYVCKQVIDLASGYELNGMWIDMIGWNGTVCYCHNCRKKYLEETGREIPEIVNWDNPEWVTFVRARERWFVDFQEMVRDAIHSVKPEISIAFQCASWTIGWGSGCTEELLQIGDYLAGDFYGNSIEQSIICKALTALSRNKPIEFMTSRCENLYYHTTTKSVQELKRAVSSAFAHNAAFVFIDAIDPVGTICDKFYSMMGEIYNEFKPIREVLNPDAELMADVGIYSNMLSAFDASVKDKHIKDTITTVNTLAPMKRIGELLIRSHIPYQIITPNNLDDCSSIQILILPNVRTLTKKEIDVIKKFVANGGSLIVTGDTGMWDENGNKLSDFALAKLTGVHFKEITNEDITYMTPVGKGISLMPENEGKYPMQVSHTQNIIEVENDVEILAELVLPYSRSDEIYKFSSAISNPPGIWTGKPSITLRKYGLGRVMYIAAPLENEENYTQKTVFTNLIKSLSTRSFIINTNAPEWIEVIAYYDCARNTIQLSLVKTMHEWFDATVYDVRVDLKVPKTVCSIADITTGKSITFVQSGETLSIVLPEVSDFTMLLINME